MIRAEDRLATLKGEIERAGADRTSALAQVTEAERQARESIAKIKRQIEAKGKLLSETTEEVGKEINSLHARRKQAKDNFAAALDVVEKGWEEAKSQHVVRMQELADEEGAKLEQIANAETRRTELLESLK